jgi:hypothetical protein
VQKLPDIAFDRKQTDVTWVIFLEEVDFFQGGRP